MVNCFFMPSSSSFCPFSSFCLGSNFFCRTSRSRRPSLLPKIAPSMLIVPTLVPVPAPVVAGVEAAGVAGAAAEPDGVAALPVWANAEIVNVTAAARSTRKNLLFIGSLELLGTSFRE